MQTLRINLARACSRRVPRVDRAASLLAATALVLLGACGDAPLPTAATPATPAAPYYAIGVATGGSASGATIETNKDDYVPGEVVHLELKGWQANEHVRLFMTEAPDTHGPVDTTITVDGSGAWSGHFYDVQTHDLGSTFTLTATGMTSGSAATVVFTDGGLTIVTSPVSLFISLTATKFGGSATCQGTGDPIGVDYGEVTVINQNQSMLVVPPIVAGYAYSGFAHTGTAIVTANPGGICITSSVNGSNAGAAGQITLNYVVQANTAPVLASIGDKSIAEHATLSFSASAPDDGLPAAVTYGVASPAAGTYPAGIAIDPSSGLVSWTPTEAQGPGTYRVKIVATDGVLSDFEEIEIAVTEVNAEPVLDAIAAQVASELVELGFNAAASDGDLPTQALAFSLGTPDVSCGHPIAAGAAISAAGAFTWTPTEAQGPGTFCARIVVSDGALSDFQDVVITVSEGNAAPVLGSIANKTGDELVALTFNATATDGDVPAQTLAYSLETPAAACGHGAAAGATITPAGAFSWTPTEAQGPGVYCVRVQVTDGEATDHQDFTVTVNEVNVPPVLDAIGSKSVNELAALTFTAGAADSDVPAQATTFSLGTPAAACGHPIATGATITPAGGFSWTPTETQGPGTFCARIQVTDGEAGDFEDIAITVNEVNVAPVLTVPADFSIQWGVPLTGKTASATDADLPANTLLYSLVSAPSGMTIDQGTGAITWTPSPSQVGANTVSVRVADNGSPSMSDTEEFIVTVLAHPTRLTYSGSTGGQYSDELDLQATLVDDGAVAALNGTPLSGHSIAFSFNGAGVGAGTSGLTGEATYAHAVLLAEGAYAAVASFAGTSAYGASTSPSVTIDIDAEDGTVTPDVANASAFQVASAGGTGSVTLKFHVREDVTPSPEPDVNDGALAGAIANAGLTVTLSPVSGGAAPSSSSCPQTTSGSGYGAVRTYTCTFTGVVVDAYEVRAQITAGGSPSAVYYTGDHADAITVYDPSLGFVTGGGKFMIGEDRVSFGLVFNFVGKGKTTPRGNLVVIRHHADGSSCRAKSNSIDAPAVIGTTASFSGKGNYGCFDASGLALQGGQGNLTFTGWVADNGEPGSSATTTPDKFWVKVMGELSMAGTGPTAAAALTGGNIQVPQPRR